MFLNSSLGLKRRSFDTAFRCAGLLALAKKYEIDAVKDFVAQHIRADWPTTLEEWRCQNAEIARMEDMHCGSCNAARGTDGPYLADLFPEPASVIRLCIAYNLREPLYSAFYQLSNTRFEDDYDRWQDKEGKKWKYFEYRDASRDADHSPLLNWRRTARWSLLDGNIFMRLLVGRNRLNEYMGGHLVLGHSKGCTGTKTIPILGGPPSSVCATELKRLLMVQWVSKHGEPLGPLEELSFMLAALELPSTYKLCETCRKDNRESLETTMSEIWDLLPNFFGVKS